MVTKNTCYNISYQDLNELRFTLKNNLNRLNSEKVNSLYYGYKCDASIENKINSISILIDSLTRLLKYAYYGSTCLSQNDVQSIVEKCLTVSGKTLSSCTEVCNEVNTDESQLKEWTLINPKCVAYESYEKYALEYCGEIGIKVSIIEKEACNLVLAIKREIVDCNILLSATAFKEACDLGLKVSRTQDECKIDWKLTVENGLNINYKEYKALQDSNLSYNIINEVYKKGNVIFQNSAGEVILKTPYSEHLFTDLCVDEDKLLQNLTPTITKDKLLEDYI